MSVESTIEVLREDLAGVSDPALLLEAALTATGVTLPEGEQAIAVVTLTREQLLTRVASLSEDM